MRVRWTTEDLSPLEYASALHLPRRAVAGVGQVPATAWQCFSAPSRRTPMHHCYPGPLHGEPPHRRRARARALVQRRQL
jgi:hypothetical protein